MAAAVIGQKYGHTPDIKVRSVVRMKWKGFLACILAVWLPFAAGNAAGQAYGACQRELSDTVLRLHVRADNNSGEAQRVKLLVRDCVINVMGKYEAEIYDKASARQAAQEHMPEILSAAEAVLLKEGCGYGADIRLDRLWFPEKYYGDVRFPAGMYDALVVRLGSGGGKNWWCVLFPKLCFVTQEEAKVPEESGKVLEEALSEEAYAAVTSDKKPRFKIVEWLEKIW